MDDSPGPIDLDPRWLDPLCDFLCRVSDEEQVVRENRETILALIHVSPSVALQLIQRSNGCMELPWPHADWLLQHRAEFITMGLRRVNFDNLYPQATHADVMDFFAHTSVQRSVESLGGGLHDWDLDIFKPLTALTSLDLSVKDKAQLGPLVQLAPLINLRTLKLRLGSSISDTLAPLAPLKQLTQLCLAGDIKDSMFAPLRDTLTALKYLSVPGTLDGSFLDHVPSLTSTLTVLWGSSSEAARRCTGLMHINLDDAHLTPDVFTSFPALLTAQTIEASMLGSRFLLHVASSRVPLAVKSLNISIDESRDPDYLTPEHVQAFSLMTGLTSLAIDRWELDPSLKDADLAPLAALTSLRELTWDAMGATGVALVRIFRDRAFTHAPLRSFTFNGVSLFDIDPLPRFVSTLTRISITYNGGKGPLEIGPSPLLTKLQQLRNLDLTYGSDSGRVYFPAAHKLTALTLMLSAKWTSCPAPASHIAIAPLLNSRLVNLYFVLDIGVESWRRFGSEVLSLCKGVEDLELSFEILDGERVEDKTEFRRVPEDWLVALRKMPGLRRFELHTHCLAPRGQTQLPFVKGPDSRRIDCPDRAHVVRFLADPAAYGEPVGYRYAYMY